MNSRLARATLVALVLIAGCSKVPLTGRSQLNLIPSSEMMSMSQTQYADFLKQNPPSTNAAGQAQVKRVGTRIQHAVEAYAQQNNLTKRLEGYQWEYNLVESQEVNAWCMPGGKVVVYSGLLPVAQSDTGLAVVLGHEIAHAVAEHGGERMTEELATNYGGQALSVMLAKQPQQTQAMWMGAFGAGAQYGVLLPFSRAQESEADRLGLIFMSMAGYPPEAAVNFWQRMAASSAGAQKPPEMMSTHPSDETRIKNLQKEIPEARQHFVPMK